MHDVVKNLTDVGTFLVLGVVAALLIGVAKAGFGGGIAILSGPLMIYACGERARLAFGIMLPILMTCDVVAVFIWRRQWNLQALRTLALR